MAEEKRGLSGGIVFLATFVGGILGTAAGLLLAPQSGKKTREKLRDTYEATEKNINSIVKNVDEKFPHVLSKVTFDVREIPELVKSEMIALKKNAGETLSKVIDKRTAYMKEMKKTVPTSLEGGNERSKKR